MLSAMALSGVINPNAVSLHDRGLLEAFPEGLGSDDDETAGQAARALLHFRPSQANVDLVLVSLNRPRLKYSAFLAALQYAHVRDPRLVPALIRSLEVDAQDSAVWVVPLLDELDPATAAAALPALRRMTKDQSASEQTRLTAAGAIRAIGRKLGSSKGGTSDPGPSR